MLFEKEYQWKEDPEAQVVKKKAKGNYLSKSDSFTHLNFMK